MSQSTQSEFPSISFVFFCFIKKHNYAYNLVSVLVLKMYGTTSIVCGHLMQVVMMTATVC